MGLPNFLCPILILVTFVLIWLMNMQFKKSLIILISAIVISDLSLGYITGFLNSFISFIPHLDPSWEGAWTNQQLIVLFFGSVIAFIFAKIFRFTVPIYLAIQPHKNGYKIIDILRPDIHVDSTTTTTTQGGTIIDSSYEESKTAVFNSGVVSLWCEGYRNRGCAIYKTKLLEYNMDEFKKGQKLEMVSGFKLVNE